MQSRLRLHVSFNPHLATATKYHTHKAYICYYSIRLCPHHKYYKQGALKLASKSDTVTLLLLDTLVGEYAHFQAIVTTERELKDNSTYSIFFDSLVTTANFIDNFYRNLPKTKVSENRYIIYDTWSTSNATALKINNTDAPLIKFQSSHYVSKGTSCQNVEATFSYR